MTYCGDCHGTVRRRFHLSTARHRAATRPRSSGRKYRNYPAWRISLRGDYDGTPAENVAALSRLLAMS